jgi:hypothetical protein
MHLREELSPGEAKIELFLRDLAVNAAEPQPQTAKDETRISRIDTKQ